MREIDVFYLKDHVAEVNKIEQGDILLTKRSKPYAVILPYKHFLELSTIKEYSQNEKIEILKRLRQSLNLQATELG